MLKQGDAICQEKKDRGRFSVLTKNKAYAMLKQGDAICQEKHVNNQKAVFIT